MLAGGAAAWTGAAADRPNVLLIMTDDQGYGDLGVHGNPVIRTPRLDRLAHESARFESFYVSPVCSPTRASLMTGRYNYRTGVVDTYLGRSMMHADETTLAELLRDAGYRTAIFGKWHLGDNYPMRAIDQGFEQSLVHRGGGIGQPADPPGNRYFDPVLQRNGQAVRTKGYCSDIFTTAAIQFIQQHRDVPWFVYLPYNCPHTPLQAPEAEYYRYRAMNLAHDRFPDRGYPLRGTADQDAIARIYAMVSNIDSNVGRLLDTLDRLALSDNTIVIFLSDNGPQIARYNAGMRGRKGSVYDGGIRVPCFVRWPRVVEPRTIDRVAAHIDLVPTLLEACGVMPGSEQILDGRSLLPLLKGETENWADRELFFQWHRGDVPQRYRNCAVRTQNYKLVSSAPVSDASPLPNPRFELFDMRRDPFEQHDIADEHPQIVARLRRAYDRWFDAMQQSRGYDPPRIAVGTSHENPVVLTPQDWRGPRAGWRADSLGYWEIDVATPKTYRVVLRFRKATADGEAILKVAGIERRLPLATGATSAVFESLMLPTGAARLEAIVVENGVARGVSYVNITRR